MTNGDYIRSLSDDQLADVLQNVADSCYYHFFENDKGCDTCFLRDAGCFYKTPKVLAVWLSEERKND